MELSLERPLLFFDIESTGLNIVNDCIVELSFVKVFPDGHHDVKTWRVCPWDYTLRKQHPINPEASQVNGIKDEDVAKEKKFIEIAAEVVDWLRDSDLAGYNSTKFDLPVLSNIPTISSVRHLSFTHPIGFFSYFSIYSIDTKESKPRRLNTLLRS